MFFLKNSFFNIATNSKSPKRLNTWSSTIVIWPSYIFTPLHIGRPGPTFKSSIINKNCSDRSPCPQSSNVSIIPTSDIGFTFKTVFCCIISTPSNHLHQSPKELKRGISSLSSSSKPSNDRSIVLWLTKKIIVNFANKRLSTMVPCFNWLYYT